MSLLDRLSGINANRKEAANSSIRNRLRRIQLEQYALDAEFSKLNGQAGNYRSLSEIFNKERLSK